MNIVGVDTETTGFNHATGDRIVEVCFGLYLYDPVTDTLEHLKSVTQRINPERNIPVEAQRVHGISLEDLRGMPTWSDFAPKAEKILNWADTLVIHNAAFDQPFLEGQMRDAGSSVRRVPTFCTMENGRWATFDGKKPSLGELAWSLGVPYNKAVAHAADYDVGVMMECYRKAIRLGFFPKPTKGT